MYAYPGKQISASAWKRARTARLRVHRVAAADKDDIKRFRFRSANYWAVDPPEYFNATGRRSPAPDAS